MKITHVVSTFPPYNGGMGNVAFQMVSTLSKMGHDVEVITPQYGNEPDGEVRQFAKHLKPSISFGNAAVLPDIVNELNESDIVHLHYPFFGTANLVRKWKKKNPQKPLVVTYHMDARASGFKELFFRLYAKFWMSKIFNSADLLHVSSWDYLYASEAAKISAKSKEKWLALPFGVDTNRFKPGKLPEDLFSFYNLDPNLPTLLFVGGMDIAHAFKGIPYLLRAVQLLHAAEFKVQLVAVGDGELKSKYQAESAGLGINKFCKFVGRVSDEELPIHYNMADLFVLPSISSAEAFGMVLIEAMASGVPVIASDLPGVSSVANDGGIVVPPKNPKLLAESIQNYLLQSSKERVISSSKVRNIAEEKYSWNSIMSDMEKEYIRLVEKLKV